MKSALKGEKGEKGVKAYIGRWPIMTKVGRMTASSNYDLAAYMFINLIKSDKILLSSLSEMFDLFGFIWFLGRTASKGRLNEYGWVPIAYLSLTYVLSQRYI